MPSGFRVEIFASGLHHPRTIAVAPNGDVFCTQPLSGTIVVLRQSPGKPLLRIAFASGLTLPFGIAFRNNYLYVADTDAVVRFHYKEGQIKASGSPEVIVRGIPGRGYRQHWTRGLAFSKDGSKMYVSVGSRTNVSVEPPPRASILEYNPDGSGGRVFASGLRNPAGLAVDPVTGKLWCACNERDELGDNLPPDFATSVQAGGFYGWPYYYAGPHHDPRLPQEPQIRRRVIAPDVLIQAHSSALGICFYTGDQFPQSYHNDAFVALHGSWNRHLRTGYKIIRIHLDHGKPAGGYEEFVTGWMLSPRDRRVWGRPVYLAVAKDGSLLIVDDAGDKIWRVTYGS